MKDMAPKQGKSLIYVSIPIQNSEYIININLLLCIALNLDLVLRKCVFWMLFQTPHKSKISEKEKKKKTLMIK